MLKLSKERTGGFVLTKQELNDIIYSDFEKHKNYAPFYSSVMREGVRMDA